MLTYYVIILLQPSAMMSSEEYPGSPPPPPMGAPSGLLGLHRPPQAHQLSPYLNVNPSYVQTPEFIVNQVRMRLGVVKLISQSNHV